MQQQREAVYAEGFTSKTAGRKGTTAFSADAVIIIVCLQLRRRGEPLARRRNLRSNQEMFGPDPVSLWHPVHRLLFASKCQIETTDHSRRRPSAPKTQRFFQTPRRPVPT